MKLITDRTHYTSVVEDGILKADSRIWIATANVKDLHVPGRNRGSLPLLRHFEKLQRKGVNIRILHGARPSAPFRNTLAELTELHNGDGFEMQLCPRVHSKIVIVDNRMAYTGSANLTGAGIGAKSDKKRNFESGVITEDPHDIQELEEYFDGIWIGLYCGKCGRRNICPAPIV
ncbi:MAG: phospholipase D family protein [Candidatus Fermentibacteria bacterium]|nr:phospholipase D family protein [Candidatus Fermentibacteria bacterium]